MFSLVIPFYRDTHRLERTLTLLEKEAEAHGIREVLLCQNGTAEHWRGAQELARRPGPAFRYFHTEAAGLGAGYGLGIRHAEQPHLILSASDLPFGFTDLRAYQAALAEAPGTAFLGVGSKFHPASRVAYGPGRRHLSRGFRLARSLLFPRLGVADTQGTLLGPTRTLRSLHRHARELGYLFSLELILAARAEGVPVRELPVELNEEFEATGIRIFRDSWRMAWGLLRLRARF